MKQLRTSLGAIFCTVLAGCCIPLMGPCAEEEFIYAGASREHSVRIDSDSSGNASIPAYLTSIAAGTGAPVALKGPTNSVYLPEGTYFFQGYTVSANSKPWNLAISCKRPLKAGPHRLRGLQMTSGRMMSRVIVIQDAAGDVVCRDTSAAAPLPDWASALLAAERRP